MSSGHTESFKIGVSKVQDFGKFELLSWFLLQEDLNTETLHKQFLITQKETNTSHVMEYGDKVSFCLFDLILYVPVNNLSVTSGHVSLG